jgi:hypothetical protein
MFVSQQLNVFIMYHIYPSQIWWEEYSIIWSNTPRGNGLRSIKFYSVDVNDVPAILLKRAEVSVCFSCTLLSQNLICGLSGEVFGFSVYL